MQQCELSHLGGCSGPLQRHHVLNRGHLRNIPKALKYCDDHADVLTAQICAAHNTLRVADTKQARAMLLQARVDSFGYDYVSGVLEGLRALTKSHPSEWRLEGLLGYSHSQG